MKLSDEAKLIIGGAVVALLYQWLRETVPNLIPDKSTLVSSNPITGHADPLASILGTVPEGGVSQAIIKANNPAYGALRACELGQSSDPRCRQAMLVAITIDKVREESISY